MGGSLTDRPRKRLSQKHQKRIRSAKPSLPALVAWPPDRI